MTIRKKILLTNIALILLLLALVLFITFYIMRVFIKGYGDELEGIEMQDDYKLSLYELQAVFDGLIRITIETDGNVRESIAFNQLESFLDRSATLAEIKVDGKTIYRTEGYNSEEIYKIACKTSDRDIDKDVAVIHSDSNGFMYRTDFKLKDGTEASLLLVNSHTGSKDLLSANDKFQSNRVDRIKNSVVSISVLGIMTIFLINLVVATAVSNNITSSLNKLKEGAKMIGEGNLEFEIEDDTNDEITEVIQTFDLMRRKLYESTIRQKMQEDHKKEMIAGISHDLRTPLTSIKGYVSGLIDGIADSPEKEEKYLKTILNTTEDMGNLIDDLFLFSTLDLDKIDFNFIKTDIIEYLNFCIEDLKFSMEKRNLLITFTNLIDGRVYTMIDKNQFSRVLLNIADNAAKYKVNEIGRLDISTELIGDYVKIVLKDDGKGVSPRCAARLFDSFYRIDPARTNPVSGSGLGLAITKQIVEAHKGKIYAQSNFGQGLAIVIELNIMKDS